MESSNSPTRTYSTPTCTLTVSTKAKQLSHPQVQPPARGGGFVLAIDRDDRGRLERTTLHGELQALDQLQLIVSNYIADLITKFPLPTTTPVMKQPPQSKQIVDRSPTHERHAPSPSGLMKNLPGLRDSQAQSAPGNRRVDRLEQSGHGKISKFISVMNQEERQNLPHSETGSPSRSTRTTAPYLTGGNGSLDHQLHLGHLATPQSGKVQVLSAIQLFDLATVLEEYAITRVPKPTTQSGTKVHAQSLAAGGVKRVDVESTASSLARLPKLPKIPTEPESELVHSRQQSRSDVMSVIPWAAGAAAVVGGTAMLLGFGSNDFLNSLKDSIGKIKMPSFLANDRVAEQKTVTSKPTGEKVDGTIDTTPSISPSVALPQPWQAQPSLQPPTAPQPTVSVTPTGQPTKTNIGLGTMPAQIAPSGNDLNPLISGIDGLPRPTGAMKTPSPKTATGATPKTTAKPAKSGNVSLSTHAIPILQNPIADLPPTQRPKQVPISPQATPAGGGIDPPTVIDPETPRKATNSAKPATVATKPQVQASQSDSPVLTPSPTIEPKSYKPNPNLITTQPSPEQSVPPSNATESESPAPQIVPDRSTQANNGQFGSEATENTSLQEAKRYFQGKWKATPTQTNVLQYVLDVDNKNGTVRSVNPQGEEANNYLKESKLIKPGQKIVTPVAGDGDQKIRVLLHPDGNVDTFVEP
jgi:hypothetical protein